LDRLDCCRHCLDHQEDACGDVAAGVGSCDSSPRARRDYASKGQSRWSTLERDCHRGGPTCYHLHRGSGRAIQGRILDLSSWSNWRVTESGLEGGAAAAVATDDDGGEDDESNSRATHGHASDDGESDDQPQGCGDSEGGSTRDKTDRRRLAGIGLHRRRYR
jgi:hypothetical protein